MGAVMRMGPAGMNGVGTLQGGAAVAEEDEDGSPCRLPPLVLEQAGGGELCGRTTGAKALFCLTAEIILTGENEKPPGGAEAAVPDGSEMEEAPSGGLAGTTAGGRSDNGAGGRAVPRPGTPVGRGGEGRGGGRGRGRRGGPGAEPGRTHWRRASWRWSR